MTTTKAATRGNLKWPDRHRCRRQGRLRHGHPEPCIRYLNDDATATRTYGTTNPSPMLCYASFSDNDRVTALAIPPTHPDDDDNDAGQSMLLRLPEPGEPPTTMASTTTGAAMGHFAAATSAVRMPSGRGLIDDRNEGSSAPSQSYVHPKHMCLYCNLATDLYVNCVAVVYI